MDEPPPPFPPGSAKVNTTLPFLPGSSSSLLIRCSAVAGPGVTDYLVSPEILYPHTKSPSKFGAPVGWDMWPPHTKYSRKYGVPLPNTLENMASPYQIY